MEVGAGSGLTATASATPVSTPAMATTVWAKRLMRIVRDGSRSRTPGELEVGDLDFWRADVAI